MNDQKNRTQEWILALLIVGLIFAAMLAMAPSQREQQRAEQQQEQQLNCDIDPQASGCQ